MGTRKTQTLFASVCCVLALFGHAFAEPQATALTSATLQEATESIARIRLDASGKPAFLARFSDGPRRVPLARGAAKERAERLGLGGGREQMRPFLWTRPEPELLAEVRGEAPTKLLWPVVGGTFGRGFGFTRTLRPELPHNGVDIGAKLGSVVRAAADGLVVYSDNRLPGYGNCVMILHANGWLTLYAHNLRTTVQAGWRVKRGERIGLVGQTGYAWGPHLHFELRDNGKLRDPEPLFMGRKSDEVNGPLVALEGALPSAGAAADGGSEHEPVTQAALQNERPAEPESPLEKATRLLQRAASAEELASATGERGIHGLLWPLKGGTLRSHGARLAIDAAPGSVVWAAADGVVVYSGAALPGYYGNVVVLLHGNGWVTLYGGVQDPDVKLGEHVVRGQWLAHVAPARNGGRSAFAFEWRDGGKLQAPAALRERLVGVP